MKTTHILFILFIVSTQLAKSQHAVYNFPNWPKGDITRVKYGTMASLRIDNINTLFYKVTIKGDKVLDSTPVPSQLQSLFRLPEPAKQASDATEGAGEGEEATKKMQSVASEPKIGIMFKKEMTTLVNLCEAFLKEADSVVLIKLRRAELTALAKFPWPRYSDLTKQLPVSRLEVSTMQRNIRNFSIAYGKAKGQYKVALNAAPTDSIKKEIQQALTQFEEAYEHIDEDNLIKMIDDLMALQNALYTDFFFSVSAPSVQADDCDFIKYSIVIERDPQNNRFLPAGSFQPIDVEIPVQGGWKADFSVGLNFSSGKGARDGKFYLKPTTDGKGTLTSGQNINAVRPSVAAMLHAYPRTGKNWAAGFMMGVGAGYKEENTLTANYYLGGSLILGKRQRIIVSTGVSFLAVDRLKAGYQEGDAYVIDSTKMEDITEKAIRPSYFLGVSYNITNRTVVK